jgi:ubiquinone/menaquinone biosynthesis C-methylase UbiE
MLKNLRHRLRFFWQYLSGRPRWDSGITPPEVWEFIQTHPAGRAIDFGCGTGTNVITLAQNGWQAIGVDFIPSAVAQAREKAKTAGVRVEFLHGDVTNLPMLNPPFDLILDMGCFHGIPAPRRAAYRQTVQRLLAPGGVFMLYAMHNTEETDSRPGITKAAIEQFAQNLTLTRRVDSADPNGRDSVWLWFQK